MAHCRPEELIILVVRMLLQAGVEGGTFQARNLRRSSVRGSIARPFWLPLPVDPDESKNLVAYDRRVSDHSFRCSASMAFSATYKIRNGINLGFFSWT
jgi:hypothetical protein